MKALKLVTLMLTLVSLTFCIPATARNGRSTQLPIRMRGVKLSGEPEKAAAKTVPQNPGRELGGDTTESGSNSTNLNVAESVRRSRRIEEKSRPRGRKRIEGNTIPTTTTPITTTATLKAAEPSKTPESDFVFENDNTVQQANAEESVNETTKPPEIEDPKNVTTESAVTTSKVDVMERTSETKPVTSKKQDLDKNVLTSSRFHGCHQHWPNFNDYHQIPPEYFMPQMEVPQHGPPMASWNFNEPYTFYPSPLPEGTLPWSPFQEQPYETPYYPMWPEEEQFYQVEPYWWDNEMNANERRCHGKKKVRTTTTTTTTSTTTTAATTTPSPVATEPTTTPIPTATTAATKATIAMPIPKSNSTWMGIEDLLEAYKSDLLNDADASSRKQLSKMFHEIIQNYEPLLNATVSKKME